MGIVKPTFIYLNSFTTVNKDDFIGLGTNGNKFPEHTVVIAQSTTIKGLVFSIRDNTLGENESVEAETYVSNDCGATPMPTGIKKKITGPSTTTNCCDSVSGTFSVNQCDLLSVKITLTNVGALPSGVAATVIL